MESGTDGEFMSEPHTPQQSERAPDFILPDSTGVRRRLSDLLADRSLILIFYRGYW
jgi:peroxiredoxin